MDTISLVKGEQSKLNKVVKNIKKGLKSEKILLKEKVQKHRKAYPKKKQIKRARAIIYLGHIPHGFYENEMMAYFSQFGKVLKAIVARSKKTGRSRGFGFVEFQNEEVAKIAAETMNNYLMFNRLIKCRYIPPNERRANYFKTDEFNYPKKKNRKINLKAKINSIKQMNKERYHTRAQQKILQFKKFFKDKGIDFSLKVNNTFDNGSSASLIKTLDDSCNQTDDQMGILEIDESDNDICFKTPPNVKKVIIKSSDSSVNLKPSKKLMHSTIESKTKSATQLKKKKINSTPSNELKSSKKSKKVKEIALKTLKNKSLNKTELKKTLKSAQGKNQLKSTCLKPPLKSMENGMKKKNSKTISDAKTKKLKA